MNVLDKMREVIDGAVDESHISAVFYDFAVISHHRCKNAKFISNIDDLLGDIERYDTFSIVLNYNKLIEIGMFYVDKELNKLIVSIIRLSRLVKKKIMDDELFDESELLKPVYNLVVCMVNRSEEIRES